MIGFRRNSSTLFRLLLTALPVVLLVLLAVFALAAHAEPVDGLPKPTDYVSDYAHVLSPETVARLDRLCTQLDKSQANAQVAVVTVKSLDGDDSADYASQLETKWKMGSKGSDRGVLVLLAVDDHKRRIDVGYGLEGILNDAKLGDIGRGMVPYLRANDFDSAVTLAVGQVAQVIAADAKVTLTDDAGQMPVQQPVRRAPALGRIILLIILLLFFGGSSLLRMLMGFGLLGTFMGGRGPGIGGGGFGGGGFGGGGGGGGFGGFGGGGFGGGGAGGDW
jgi:uncharacterized protein